ncbi:hypothetical protein [Paenibacillus popilliae]|uniref:Uncharacterized protein n=1 Tax=Paenibacillus popilliae TaxID=78057 RepID=A0ABY3AJK5_PAEPP|nr:hypothetical protein [Paenibacillus sp. SDF0028]TQR42114.1 hypothetical protein C7Y44_23500 [Paenibacillus sp. SDF0028]
MYDADRVITVFAGCETGIEFIRQLKGAGYSVAGIAHNGRLAKRLEGVGVHSVCRINTTEPKAWAVPHVPIGRIYVFEQSFALSCRLLQICRQWTTDPITIVTKRHHPQSIYRLLGANYVIYTQSDQVSFLLSDII